MIIVPSSFPRWDLSFVCFPYLSPVGCKGLDGSNLPFESLVCPSLDPPKSVLTNLENKIRYNNCAYNYDYNTLVVWELNGWSSVMSLTGSVTTAFPSLLKRTTLSMNTFWYYIFPSKKPLHQVYVNNRCVRLSNKWSRKASTVLENNIKSLIQHYERMENVLFSVIFKQHGYSKFL